MEGLTRNRDCGRKTRGASVEKEATTGVPDSREIPEVEGAVIKTFGGARSARTGARDRVATVLEGISTR